jgi:hypothetical protein
LPYIAVGVTAVETPITEESWDGWLWHSYFAVKSGGIIDGTASTDDNQINGGSAVLRLPIDTKAMRKLNQEDVIYAAIEVTESGTSTARVHLNSRSLVMLP